MQAITSYQVPKSIHEASEILAAGEVTILAGGTDLKLQADAGRIPVKSILMNIRRIDEMRLIESDNHCIRIGALCTINELRENVIIKQHLTILAKSADHFASDQIRNAGTIGGNICNASPAGDTLVPLLVLKARVVLASIVDGSLQQRLLPVEDYFVAPGKTNRAANELLTHVEIPLPEPGFVAAFEKFGTRPALDIAMVSVAIGGVREGEYLKNARAAFGAVAPVPLLAKSTMLGLEENPLDNAGIERIAEIASAEVNPISDVRASAGYRKSLIKNLCKKVLRQCR